MGDIRPSSFNSPSTPHLRKTLASSQLIVNGKPFLMLAGELHNSSLSSAKYMATILPEMKSSNLNTLLGSVTWEMIEPTEGQFDFSRLDEVILEVRKHEMHLVLLWFGSFKNALSTYAPGWVKKNVKRFPRVHISKAGAVTKTLELISPFCEAGWRAESRAFSALMSHLRQFDADHSTVLMVQVDNETGLLGDSRDRSRTAEQKFAEPVPPNLINYLRTASGSSDLHPKFLNRFPHIQDLQTDKISWREAFRGDADEMFMANAFSQYVNHVAAAGKVEYSIPFYTNVWLNFDEPEGLDLNGLPETVGTVGGGGVAGVYPSGGCVPHCFDIWRFNTKKSLDFLAPDLYFHDYNDTCQNYRYGNQPLFIPEQRRDERGARRIWAAYGTHLAIGTAPFGIDSLKARDSPITKHYGLLNSVCDIVLDTQANRPNEIMGFYFDELENTTVEPRWERAMGDFKIVIQRAFVFGRPGTGAGMVIHLGNGKFLLVGWGFQVVFESVHPQATFTGILSAEEKEVITDANGQKSLRTLRVMNGDETRSGEFMIMPNEEPDYGGFPIAVTIPCRTMIAECSAYSIFEEAEDF